jgi:hypothetical protein
MKCPNIFRKGSRERFWTALSEAHPVGFMFIQALPLLQQFYIILGLIEVNDENVQESTAIAGEQITLLSNSTTSQQHKTRGSGTFHR